MHKFCGNRGKFLNFIEIGGNIQYASLAYRGVDTPENDDEDDYNC